MKAFSIKCKAGDLRTCISLMFMEDMAWEWFEKGTMSLHEYSEFVRNLQCMADFWSIDITFPREVVL